MSGKKFAAVAAVLMLTLSIGAFLYSKIINGIYLRYKEFRDFTN